MEKHVLGMKWMEKIWPPFVMKDGQIEGYYFKRYHNGCESLSLAKR